MGWPNYRIIEHDRYKYQLLDPFEHVITTPMPSQRFIVARDHEGKAWATLRDGILNLRAGYAWNGPDVITDTVNMQRASLVHDAGYQLIAKGLLPKRPFKKVFDHEFKRLMKLDHVPWYRRAYAFVAVRLFGKAEGKYDSKSIPALMRDAAKRVRRVADRRAE